MNITGIITAVIVIGVMGLIFGAILGIASKIFYVKTDERIEQISKLLPGANCGGCGYAGCGAFAEAIVNNGAELTRCAASNDAIIEKIAQIVGKRAVSSEKKVACVMCKGTNTCAGNKYEYHGISSCNAAVKLGGGQKICDYGCLGFGTCVTECRFNAISVKDGVAVVNSHKCTGCGMCANACPKNIISLIPKTRQNVVLCSSKAKGPVVNKACSSGCIGCRICEKNCPSQAIKVENNLAVIDYSKCTACGICAQKCPKKVIA